MHCVEQITQTGWGMCNLRKWTGGLSNKNDTSSIWTNMVRSRAIPAGPKFEKGGWKRAPPKKGHQKRARVSFPFLSYSPSNFEFGPVCGLCRSVCVFSRRAAVVLVMELSCEWMLLPAVCAWRQRMRAQQWHQRMRAEGCMECYCARVNLEEYVLDMEISMGQGWRTR